MMAMLRILSMGETNYSVKLSELRGPQYGRTRWRSQPKVQSSYRRHARWLLQTAQLEWRLREHRSRPSFGYCDVSTADRPAHVNIRAEVCASYGHTRLSLGLRYVAGIG